MSNYKDKAGVVALIVTILALCIISFQLRSISSLLANGAASKLGASNATNYTNLGVETLKVGTGCGSEYTMDTCSGISILTSGATTLGSTTVDSLKVGASSTPPVTMWRTGTCNLVSAGAHLASTTKEYTCSATGVAPGDKVFVSLATTSSGVLTSGLVGSVYVQGAKATSSNQIGVGIYNDTGADVNIYAGVFSGIASGTQWTAIRNN